MTLTAEVVSERVARGVAFLDQHVPGWHERINLDRLDISACKMCVLGQLGGDYFKMRDALDLKPPEATMLGFSVVGDVYLSNFQLSAEACALLTDTWRESIRARRTTVAIVHEGELVGV